MCRRSLLAGIILGLCVACHAQPPEEAIDLGEALIVATHEMAGGKAPPTKIIDGDLETFWGGDEHDLTYLSTNIILTLPEPTVIGGLEVITQVLKARLRLTDLEVYARVGDGWALLGAARGNQDTRFNVAFRPAKVKQLRLRVMDTARPDHAFPRINEVRLLSPGAGPDGRPVGAHPVAGETNAERYFLRAILGEQPELPSQAFDPGKGYLYYVRTFLDTLLSRGTDRYGPTPSPMFVSILDCATKEHPGCELPPIEGQRQGDRAPFGGNLQHDLMLLRACSYVSQMTGDEKYRQAADAYLRFFLDNCTSTPTGLWPWGEHAHWDFIKEAPGHNTHEYLGAAPIEFWAQAWEMNPKAVLREADGLLNHVVNLQTFDYNRHADISQPLATPRPKDMVFLDFPRHGGFYTQVWAFAYSRTGDGKYLDWCGKMMDHFESVRHAQSGLLPSTSTTSAGSCGVTTQLSLAVTMLESAPLLGATPTGARCKRLAMELLDAVAGLPHKASEGLYCLRCPIEGPKAGQVKLTPPGSTAHYGGPFLAMDALLWARAYRLTGDRRCLDIAEGLARFYATTKDSPAAENTRAHIYGTVIELLVDMDELVGGPLWLPAAEGYAQKATGLLYCGGLFRGATNLWYYESQLWPGTFVYALVRLHARLAQPNVLAQPNYFHR